MLENKKPSQMSKKLPSNEIELKVNFLDDSSHVFNVKVGLSTVNRTRELIECSARTNPNVQ